jgi:hypothetical protein
MLCIMSAIFLTEVCAKRWHVKERKVLTAPVCLWLGALALRKTVLQDLGTPAPRWNPGWSKRLTFMVLLARMPYLQVGSF